MFNHKKVTVKIDRPLGTFHPEHKDLYYPINYGYIEGLIAEDGEEQDAYVLGVNKPVETFSALTSFMPSKSGSFSNNEGVFIYFV